MPGTEWEMKFWWSRDQEEWYPVIPLSQTTITFGPDGEASGSGGCNNYTVSYEGDLQVEKVMEATDTYAELPALTFGPVATDMRACVEPEGVMDQEQAFFIALGSTAYYFKLGGMLMLLDNRGVPLTVLAARSGPTAPASQATPTPDPAIYNQVPDTTVFEPGECIATLDAPAPAHTSNSLGGEPSGEIAPGEYEVLVAAAYETSLWYALNTEGPANYVNSSSVSTLAGACAASNP
jgi:heat shock protein HslJ